jgi:hypothetical protein
MRRIVISLTTSPVRIRAMRDMLMALATQDGGVAEILLNLPYRFARTGEPYDIPDWIAAVPKLRINRCRDYGPATKLLGALECETAPDTLIITVDDDVLYPDGMVAAYRRSAAGGETCAYCTCGFNIADPFAFAIEVRGSLLPVRGHLMRVQVAEGYGSCLYRRSFFDSDIFAIQNVPDFLRYSDDIYISNYLARRTIGIRTVQLEGFGGPKFWQSRMLPYGLGSDALHRNEQIGTNRQRYALAVDYLIRNNIYFLDGLPGYPRTAQGKPNSPCVDGSLVQ